MLNYIKASSSRTNLEYDSEEEAAAAIEEYKAAVMEDGDEVAGENESGADGEERQGQQQAVGNLLLAEMHEVRNDKAGTTVGGVARSDGGCYDSKDGQDGTNAAHPCRTNHIDEQGRIG